jgi:hypothetical protein
VPAPSDERRPRPGMGRFTAESAPTLP